MDKKTWKTDPETKEQMFNELHLRTNILAKKYKRDPGTISYYKRQKRMKENPEKEERIPTVYEQAYYLEERKRLERQMKCKHPHWVMQCSMCKKILASDATADASTTMAMIFESHQCDYHSSNYIDIKL